MNTIFFDPSHDDASRRASLFDGQLFVYSPTPETLGFVEFARQMVEAAFDGLDPELAQHSMEVEEYAAILGELKPKFIHHPESKAHPQAVLRAFGCDPRQTYFEVPKMRSSTSGEYLTAGIAYAWHPHRDTWYSAPQCQINWWMPLYDIEPENAMAFHPRYWDEPVTNSSSGYNYYSWNRQHRGKSVVAFTKKDPRPLPAPLTEIDRSVELRVVCPVGSLILFSGAQLHSSVPNTSGKTRFSVDFRTVNSEDLETGAGAPNLDAESTGTVLREFRSVDSLSELPEEIIRKYEDGTESSGPAVYAEAESSNS